MVSAQYEIELLEVSATAFLFGERGKYAPPGVVGGGPGAPNRFYFDSDGPDAFEGRESPPLVSKMTGIKLKRGQKVRLETPGGGGYGDAATRTDTQHAHDVAQGYVTAGNRGHDS